MFIIIHMKNIFLNYLITNKFNLLNKSIQSSLKLKKETKIINSLKSEDKIFLKK